MSRNIPLEDIPDSSVVPDGVYNVQVALIEIAASKSGKLMYKASYRIEDGECADQVLFDNFVIGSDDDPDAIEGNTWKKFGGQRWKKLIKAASVPFLNDETELIMALQSQKLSVVVTTEEDKTGKYDAQNRIKRYLPYGSPA